MSIFDAAFATQGTSICDITRTFTGQVLDNETGLMLYRNRVYHPTLGRFVQRDPSGYDARDISLYRYVSNAPQVRWDTFGLDDMAIALTCWGMGGTQATACDVLANYEYLQQNPPYPGWPYLPPPQPEPEPKEPADKAVYCCKKFEYNYKTWGFSSADECARSLPSIHPLPAIIAGGSGDVVALCLGSGPVGVVAIGASAIYTGGPYLHNLDMCNRISCQDEATAEWKYDKDKCKWKWNCPEGYSLYQKTGEFGAVRPERASDCEKPWWSDFNLGRITIMPL